MSAVGDETIELLTKEADRWNHSGAVSMPLPTRFSEHSNCARTTPKDKNISRQRGDLLPRKYSPKDLSDGEVRDHPHHQQPRTPMANSAKRSVHSSDGDLHALNDHATSTRKNLAHGSETHIAGSLAKRQKTTMHPSNYQELNSHEPRFSLEGIPPLALDSDLDILVKEPRESGAEQDSDPPNKSAGGRNNLVYINANKANGLNLRVSPDADEQRVYEGDTRDQPEFERQAQPEIPSQGATSRSTDAINGLVDVIETKDAELKALRNHIDEMKREHMAEITALTKELHAVYSKQASKKMRLLYKKAEITAQHKAEEKWASEVEELRKSVQTERSEKTDLVKACDEYLKLFGF